MPGRRCFMFTCTSSPVEQEMFPIHAAEFEESLRKGRNTNADPAHLAKVGEPLSVLVSVACVGDQLDAEFKVYPFSGPHSTIEQKAMLSPKLL